MPRLTDRGFGVLALVAGTYFAARLVGTWELYLFAFAFLAALVLSWLLVLATGRRLRVERTVDPERPMAGEEAEFTFSVKNASLVPGPQLTLRSALEGFSALDLELEGESLGPRRERVLRASAGEAERGVHLLPPIQLLAEDPLGLVRTARRVGDPLAVTVYPRLVHLSSCAIYADIGLRRDWGGYGLLIPGASEFRSIRPHQPGEPLSHIDWKSSAKTGILMLREMEEPAGSDVTLLLDGTAAHVVGELPDTSYELALRATGSIADFALRSGRGVNLLRHEKRWRQARLTADAGGRRQLLETLAEASPDAPSPIASSLRHLRMDGSRMLHTHRVTLVSLSLDQSLVRALIGLREDGVRVSLIHVAGATFAGARDDNASLLPFLPPRESQSHGEETHTKAHGLSNETRAHLLTLSMGGVPCLTLARSDDLLTALSLWGGDAREARAL